MLYASLLLLLYVPYPALLLLYMPPRSSLRCHRLVIGLKETSRLLQNPQELLKETSRLLLDPQELLKETSWLLLDPQELLKETSLAPSASQNSVKRGIPGLLNHPFHWSGGLWGPGTQSTPIVQKTEVYEVRKALRITRFTGPVVYGLGDPKYPNSAENRGLGGGPGGIPLTMVTGPRRII